MYAWAKENGDALSRILQWSWRLTKLTEKSSLPELQEIKAAWRPGASPAKKAKAEEDEAEEKEKEQQGEDEEEDEEAGEEGSEEGEQDEETEEEAEGEEEEQEDEKVEDTQRFEGSLGGCFR